MNEFLSFWGIEDFVFKNEAGFSKQFEIIEHKSSQDDFKHKVYKPGFHILQGKKGIGKTKFLQSIYSQTRSPCFWVDAESDISLLYKLLEPKNHPYSFLVLVDHADNLDYSAWSLINKNQMLIQKNMSFVFTFQKYASQIGKTHSIKTLAPLSTDSVVKYVNWHLNKKNISPSPFIEDGLKQLFHQCDGNLFLFHIMLDELMLKGFYEDKKLIDSIDFYVINEGEELQEKKGAQNTSQKTSQETETETETETKDNLESGEVKKENVKTDEADNEAENEAKEFKSHNLAPQKTLASENKGFTQENEDKSEKKDHTQGQVDEKLADKKASTTQEENSQTQEDYFDSLFDEKT